MNMKTIMYIVVGLVVWLNWDKISGMFKKKEQTTTTVDAGSEIDNVA